MSISRDARFEEAMARLEASEQGQETYVYGKFNAILYAVNCLVNWSCSYCEHTLKVVRWQESAAHAPTSSFVPHMIAW